MNIYRDMTLEEWIDYCIDIGIHDFEEYFYHLAVDRLEDAKSLAVESDIFSKIKEHPFEDYPENIKIENLGDKNYLTEYVNKNSFRYCVDDPSFELPLNVPKLLEYTFFDGKVFDPNAYDFHLIEKTPEYLSFYHKDRGLIHLRINALKSKYLFVSKNSNGMYHTRLIENDYKKLKYKEIISNDRHTMHNATGPTVREIIDNKEILHYYLYGNDITDIMDNKGWTMPLTDKQLYEVELKL